MAKKKISKIDDSERGAIIVPTENPHCDAIVPALRKHELLELKNLDLEQDAMQKGHYNSMNLFAGQKKDTELAANKVQIELLQKEKQVLEQQVILARLETQLADVTSKYQNIVKASSEQSEKIAKLVSDETNTYTARHVDYLNKRKDIIVQLSEKYSTEEKPLVPGEWGYDEDTGEIVVDT
jgi:hypothetical protein